VVKDVEAGREYIEAYVQFFKVAEKAVGRCGTDFRSEEN
jgi:hypothetical protein